MANKYVRAAATGAGNGSDWTNAYTALPAALTRGDVYYVGDGVYPAYTFDDAEVGTTLVTIKKATTSDHGTAVGWDNSYGDGQAVFGQFLIKNGYLTIDGQVRSADWWSDYGIRITETTGNFGCVRVSSSSDVEGLSFQYVDFLGGSRTDPALAEAAVYAFTTGLVSGLTISRCKTSLLWPDIFVIKGNDILIEYCAIDENFSTPSLHGQIVAHHDCNNVTFQFNQVRNPWGTAIYTVLGNGQSNSGLDIFGNIFYQTTELTFPDGISALVEVIQTATLSDADVSQNTLSQVGYNPRIVHVDNTGSNRVARNNLFYKCGTGETVTHLHWDVDYSWYFQTVHTAEVHQQIGTGNPFTDIDAGNFRLTAQTSPGLTLAAPHDIDLLGNIRTNWTRGALEFVASAVSSLECICIAGFSIPDKLAAIYGAIFALADDASLPTPICVAGLTISQKLAAIYEALFALSGDATLPAPLCVSGIPDNDKLVAIYCALLAAIET